MVLEINATQRPALVVSAECRLKPLIMIHFSVKQDLTPHKNQGTVGVSQLDWSLVRGGGPEIGLGFCLRGPLLRLIVGFKS